MKYNKIMTFFYIIAPAGIILRTLQLLFTVDSKGFTLNNYEAVSTLITGLIIISAVITVFIAYLVCERPENPPENRIMLSGFSKLLGIWVIVDSILLISSPAIPAWQAIVLRILGMIYGVFLLANGFQNLIRIRIPPLLFIIPVVYWIFRLIWEFTALNALALTAGHRFLLLAHCATIIFSLYAAKLYNGLDKEYNFKKILASGLCTAFICGCVSVPEIIKMFINFNNTSMETLLSNILIFLTGMLAYSFVITYFRKNITEENQ